MINGYKYQPSKTGEEVLVFLLIQTAPYVIAPPSWLCNQCNHNHTPPSGGCDIYSGNQHRRAAISMPLA